MSAEKENRGDWKFPLARLLNENNTESDCHKNEGLSEWSEEPCPTKSINRASSFPGWVGECQELLIVWSQLLEQLDHRSVLEECGIHSQEIYLGLKCESQIPE